MPTDMFKAHSAIYRAVKAGKLPRVTSLICADCGARQAEEYHHYNGHAKEHWFDVTPLCLVCHGKTRQTPKKDKPIPRKFRCEAQAKSGDQCPGWAMRDSVYCGAHTQQAKKLIRYTQVTP